MNRYFREAEKVNQEIEWEKNSDEPVTLTAKPAYRYEIEIINIDYE